MAGTCDDGRLLIGKEDDHWPRAANDTVGELARLAMPTAPHLRRSAKTAPDPINNEEDVAASNQYLPRVSGGGPMSLSFGCPFIISNRFRDVSEVSVGSWWVNRLANWS